MTSHRNPIILALLLALALSAQAATVGSLVERGSDAYKKSNYVEAAKWYGKAAAKPEDLNYPRYGILYNLACCYSLLRRGDEAFATLEKSIAGGFTSRRWMTQDKDLDFLRTTAPERFQKMLALCDSTLAKEKAEKPPIAVLEWNAYLGTFDPASLSWDDPDGPEMTELRTTYKLDSIIASGQTEFDKFKKILAWVSTRWEHSGTNECADMNATAILARAAKGEKFRCVEYGVVLANCLTALGYPARVVGLQCEGVSYGTGKGHVIAEVWSNDAQKWIALDGQNNAWWTYHGAPLSAAECRDFFIHGKEDSLEFTGQTSGWNYAQMKSDWTRYFYQISMSARHIYFPTKDQENTAITQYALDGDGVLPELFFQRSPMNWRPISDAQFLYPQLNQVRVNFTSGNYKQATDTLKVKLENTSPFFDHYLVSLNGSEWRRSDAEIEWILKPGDNRIEAKAVNSRSVEGKTAKIVLRNNLRKTQQKM